MYKRPDRRKYHILYKTTCIPTGKYYIGIHSTDDLNDGYLGSGKRLHRSIKKYGKENHRRIILEYCPDRKSLNKAEENIVNENLLSDKNCMNIALGGQNLYLHTSETRKLISQGNKGKSISEEQREKIKKSLDEYWTPEKRKEISNEKKGLPSHRKGAIMSEESKKAISSKLKGKTSNRKGIKMSEKQKRKISESMKLRHAARNQ